MATPGTALSSSPLLPGFRSSSPRMPSESPDNKIPERWVVMVDTEHEGVALRDLRLLSLVIFRLPTYVTQTVPMLFGATTSGTTWRSMQQSFQDHIVAEYLFAINTASDSDRDGYSDGSNRGTSPSSFSLTNAAKSSRWLRDISDGHVWRYYQQCLQLSSMTQNRQKLPPVACITSRPRIPISPKPLMLATMQRSCIVPEARPAHSLFEVCCAVTDIILELGSLRDANSYLHIEWVAKPATIDLTTIQNMLTTMIESGHVNNLDHRVTRGLRTCPHVCLESILRYTTGLTGMTKTSIDAFLFQHWLPSAWLADPEVAALSHGGNHFAFDDAKYQLLIYCALLTYQKFELAPALQAGYLMLRHHSTFVASTSSPLPPLIGVPTMFLGTPSSISNTTTPMALLPPALPPQQKRPHPAAIEENNNMPLANANLATTHPRPMPPSSPPPTTMQVGPMRVTLPQKTPYHSESRRGRQFITANSHADLSSTRSRGAGGSNSSWAAKPTDKPW